MEPGSAVISGLPLILCALCCQGRPRRMRERYGEAEQIFSNRRVEALFECQEGHEKEEKQESKRKTAPDWNGNTETGTRPHLYTPTPAPFFPPSQTLFKVHRGHRSYIRQTLYELCLRRRCEFASQRSPGGVLVPCCQ